MTERNRKAKRSERVATLAKRTATVLVIIFIVLAIGYTGEQDRQMELLNAGYTPEKTSK